MADARTEMELRVLQRHLHEIGEARGRQSPRPPRPSRSGAATRLALATMLRRCAVRLTVAERPVG